MWILSKTESTEEPATIPTLLAPDTLAALRTRFEIHALFVKPKSPTLLVPGFAIESPSIE
jgi:hypothetical protein